MRESPLSLPTKSGHHSLCHNIRPNTQLHSTPLHFTRSWTAAEHASPRANRSQKSNTPAPPDSIHNELQTPSPLSPTYSSLQNPGSHSEDPAPKQNKTKKPHHTKRKRKPTPLPPWGAHCGLPFSPFSCSIPFRLGLRLTAGAYPGHLDSSALNHVTYENGRQMSGFVWCGGCCWWWWWRRRSDGGRLLVYVYIYIYMSKEKESTSTKP